MESRASVPDGRGSDLVATLCSAVPGMRIQSDPDVLASYRFDQARFVEAGHPLAAAFPASTAEVAALARFAHEHRVPLVPRGAGSGLSGGANAVDGSVVVCLTSMNRILGVDPSNQIAVVQPGVLNADLKRACSEHGLHYPPDPASYEFSTVGGNIATNAGGLCCLKYGVTGDYVLGLEVVLADGTVVRTGRRTRKGVAGYDLTRLIVGSEGTLGIVTEATLRLRPAPGPAATLVASFSSLDAGGRAIESITRTLVPSMLELLDRQTVRAVEDWKPIGLDRDAEALLIMQSDGPGADELLERAQTLCNGADMLVRSSDPAEADLLLQSRRMAFPALERQGNVLLDDVSVPPARIAAFLRAVPEIARRHEVTIATFGHAGDGNLHPTVLFDEEEAGSTEAAAGAFDDLVYEAIRLGGTATGEHGVGLLKRKHLRAELSPGVLDLHARLKAALDPRGILNPGKAF